MMKRLIVCGLMLACAAQVNAQGVDSLDIKIGQMILIGLPLAEVDENVLDEVRKGKVGSIILFEKNIPGKNSFVALKKITWTYQQAAPIPLFIAIDQEGGRVNRLKDKYGFPRSISAAQMGAASTLDSVRFYGEATASTLAGLGINVNFAPCVDLASNPTNPVIARAGRAFSADEEKVSVMAREIVEAHRKMGVIAALKHFPGHGSSKDDTHHGIADVTNTWEERELIPYIRLIESGDVDAVMSAHIVNRKLDPNGYPGTLSAPILDGILRKRLNFDGVIFSDDMQMQAITKYYGLDEAVKLAVNAGIDIMTFSNNMTDSEERTVDKVHSIIKGYIRSGVISPEQIDHAYRRIMILKKKLQPELQESEPDTKGDLIGELTEELNAVKEENMRLQQELSKVGKKKKKKK